MKYKCSAVIVVEGKSDVSFLETFIEADFVITNGSEISKETIRYLKSLKEKRDIIVLTDPDFPGLQIRNKIEEQIPGVLHAYVRKEVSIKHHKVGIAESEVEEVINALKNAFSLSNKEIETDLSFNDLYVLGFVGKENSDELRKKAATYFKLGYASSAKTFYKQLKALGIKKEKLIKWKENKDDCK